MKMKDLKFMKSKKGKAKKKKMEIDMTSNHVHPPVMQFRSPGMPSVNFIESQIQRQRMVSPMSTRVHQINKVRRIKSPTSMVSIRNF